MTNAITLSIEDLRGVCNYAHWIPITQGLYKPYFKEHFPGWRWNNFLPKLMDAKVAVRFVEGAGLVHLGQGIGISQEIVAVEFRRANGKIALTPIYRAQDKAEDGLVSGQL